MAWYLSLSLTTDVSLTSLESLESIRHVQSRADDLSDVEFATKIVPKTNQSEKNISVRKQQFGPKNKSMKNTKHKK